MSPHSDHGETERRQAGDHSCADDPVSAGGGKGYIRKRPNAFGAMHALIGRTGRQTPSGGQSAVSSAPGEAASRVRRKEARPAWTISTWSCQHQVRIA